VSRRLQVGDVVRPHDGHVDVERWVKWIVVREADHEGRVTLHRASLSLGPLRIREELVFVLQTVEQRLAEELMG